MFPGMNSIYFTFHFCRMCLRLFRAVQAGVEGSAVLLIICGSYFRLSFAGYSRCNNLKMAENRDTGPLPPGWDRKYDHRTGR
jgi:hypothetical protein